MFKMDWRCISSERKIILLRILFAEAAVIHISIKKKKIRTSLQLALFLICIAAVGNNSQHYCLSTLLLQTGADISLPLGAGNALALTANSLRPQRGACMPILTWQTLMFLCLQTDFWLLKQAY